MFTGIVEDVGRVKSIEKRGAFGRISVETGLSLKDVKPGDSISVNGACLTATAVSGNIFSADVSAETLKVTTLGALSAGDAVNLELALTLSKPLGGHLVTGHIDGVGIISKKTASGENLEIEVSASEELMRHIVRKGSVAVDGISLTVAEVIPGGFRMAIIPHTMERTTLVRLPEGSKVNIETDLIAKYVEKFSSGKNGSRITEDFLAEHGFFKKR